MEVILGAIVLVAQYFSVDTSKIGREVFNYPAICTIGHGSHFI
jgi:hypothetical protein